MKKPFPFRKLALYAVNVVVILLMFFMLFQAVPAVIGASTITLDGLLGDWSGQSCISDTSGDVTNSQTDITQFCFANNPGISEAYFMAQRLDGANAVTYFLYIDADNNGSFSDPLDSVVTIDYKPIGNSSQVTVSWPGGSDNGNWGESKHDNALNVEWYVPFSALGISAGQPIQMYLASSYGSGNLDVTDVVQWSPANALGWFILLPILAAASLWMTRLNPKKVKQQ